jgi:hypothetical protein
MQWLDIEQSEAHKHYIEEVCCSARERWQCMVEAEKRGKHKEKQEEIHLRWVMKEHEAVQPHEAERERKRKKGSPGQGSWVGCHQEGEITLLYTIDLEY